MAWNPFRRAEVKNIAIGELDRLMDAQILTRLRGQGDIGELRRRVPWLFRGIDLIAQAIHDYPFDLMDDNDEVVDSSTDWQDKLGFTHDLFRLLYLVSASLTLRGKSYLYPARNRIVVKALRYWVADTITPVITEKDGLEKFVRQVGNIKTEYPVTEAAPYPLCYFWLPDPDVELGPPLAYPAQAALNAAGVLFSLDDFFKSHVDDGMKKAILFAVKGLPPTGSDTGKPAKERLESELSRLLLGKQNANKIRVVNADTMEPVVYGEGLQEIANTALTKEKREDIATALGIPDTILWSSEGGGLGGAGVTKEDTYRFYKQKIIPDFNFIAAVLNYQLLNSLGYRLVGNPETMDAFQEDETQRSTALGSITNAISADPTIARFTMDLLGYDLSEEQQAELDALIAAKEDRAARMAEQQANQPPNPVPPQLQDEPRQAVTTGETMQQKAFRDDLARWQRKVESALARGKSIKANWDAYAWTYTPEQYHAIPDATIKSISDALAGAGDADAVKAIFREAQPSESSELPFPLKSIANVSQNFAAQLTALVRDAWANNSGIIRAEMRLLVTRAVEDAFFQGLIDNGASPDNLNEADAKWIDELTAAQVQYIPKFAADTKDALNDPQGQQQIITRIGLWAEDVAKAGELGRVAAMRQVKKQLQWHTAHDELTCPICRPLNDKVVNAGEPFGEDGDGNPIYSNPAHKHCRCQVYEYQGD